MCTFNMKFCVFINSKVGNRTWTTLSYFVDFLLCSKKAFCFVTTKSISFQKNPKIVQSFWWGVFRKCYFSIPIEMLFQSADLMKREQGINT